MITWKHYHPEVAQIFDKPPTPWPHEIVRTELEGAGQPSVVRAPDGELFVNAFDRLFHSEDGGQTWAVRAEVPIPKEAVPEGFSTSYTYLDGCGVTERGTLLVNVTCQYLDGREGAAGWADDSYHCDTYILRSEDRGRTWDDPVQIDPGAFEMVGSDRTRFVRLPGGRMAVPMCTWHQSRPGRPLGPDDSVLQAFIYNSDDDGCTWRQGPSITKHGCECDLLPRPSGTLLASIRYQRRKLTHDAADLASPSDGSTAVGDHSVLKQSAFARSDDGGHTWGPPRLVTGWLQQTACLVALADGTLVMPFSYKTEYDGRRFGQRFMLSYDEGATWSRSVYQLHCGGHYASSVVLDDDTIVTVHDDRSASRTLTALRWRVPPRDEVEKGGFFEPLDASRSG